MKNKGAPTGDELRLKAVGRMLRIARENLRYSYRELAGLSGVSASQILRIESGEFDFSLTKFMRVCEALGLSVGIILENVMLSRSPRKELTEIGEGRFTEIFRERQITDAGKLDELSLLAREFVQAVAEIVAALIASANPDELCRFLSHNFSKLNERLRNYVKTVDLAQFNHFERLTMIRALMHDPYSKLCNYKVIDDDLVFEFALWAAGQGDLGSGWAYVSLWASFHVAKPIKTETAQLYIGRGPNKDLTNASGSITNVVTVKSQWSELKKRLQKATEASGAKSVLAKLLGVDPTQISQWLSDKKTAREPGGEYALQMLKWVELQERVK